MHGRFATAGDRRSTDAAVTRAPRSIRLATRLTVTLIVVVCVIVAGYMLVSNWQQQSLIEEQVEHEVDRLGAVLRLPTEDLLDRRRTRELHQLLSLSLQAEEVYAALVVDADARILAGAAADTTCLMRHLPSPLPRLSITGRADCGEGVTWTVLPLSAERGWLLVGVELLLLRDVMRGALGRQLALLLVLICAIAVAIVIILQRLVSRPLDAIMSSVQSMAATGVMPPLRLSTSAGELVQLANVLADTSSELQTRRTSLVRQTEETVQLERRLSQAERFAMIGRLSGGLAHEMGSPLSVIGLRAESICRRARGNEGVVAEARAIAAEVGRMSSFVQGLLHMSGRQGIVFDRIDVRDVVGKVVDDVAASAADAGLDLDVSLPPEAVWVRGQEATLCHALRNGVRNAIQALRNHDGERRIEVRVTVGMDDVALFVEDSGPGIADDHLPLVSDPFFTTRPVGEGTGLGLAITKGIIEEHGGEISIENREDSGVLLTLQLPLDPTQAES